MNELLQVKLEELFRELDQCKEIKELLRLKKEIYDDQELKEKLDAIKKIGNVYDPEFLDLKKEIIQFPLVNEYHRLENELYFAILEANSHLATLFHEKRCHIARN